MSEDRARDRKDHQRNSDVLLDAPQLKVERLKLGLLGILNLEVENLEAELWLEVDLENVRGLLESLMNELSGTPEGINRLLQILGEALERASQRSGSTVEATDAARRRAEELDVDLPEVNGSGSGGRVLVEDVEKAAANG